jgi:S1-C subfamily serine protease
LLLSFLVASVGGAAALGALLTLREAGADQRQPALSSTALADLGRRATVILTSGPCQGSGFFVTPDLLLTNAHVLCAESADVAVGETTVRATIVEIDDELDVALLEAEGAGRVPLPLADALSARTGDHVVAAGAAAGQPVGATPATITEPLVRLWGVLHIEADAAIAKGNSGGPLLNDRGQVIGFISKGRTAGGRRWGLALPVNYVASWLPEGMAAAGDGWETRVEDAARRAEADLAPFAAALERPMLLGAHFMAWAPAAGRGAAERALVIVVAAPASVVDDAPAEVTVRLTCGDTTPKAVALSSWVHVDQPIERTSQIDVTRLRPFLGWARRHGHAPGLLLATGIARIGAPPSCPAGQLALLDGAMVTGSVPIE